LPVAIEIKTVDGPVGIVHAETPTEWPTLLALLEGGGSISKGMRRDVRCGLASSKFYRSRCPKGFIITRFSPRFVNFTYLPPAE
jgi:hypothetical protein